ncbi:MAG: hypothetical protein HND52_06620 [Ignavibacteriae bacterium]|nr:hypothetical protein [Ignavibacteriota bacterium]NOG97615.1 hypothetical protein [Ignavibacteriota bacterium]
MIVKKLLSINLILLSCLLIMSCKSSPDNGYKDETKTRPNTKNAIPLGNADVIVSIKDLSDEGKNYKVSAEIIEVKGYGPSAPVLPTDTDINILFSKTLSEGDLSKIEEGEKVSIRISYKQGYGETGSWFFVAFNK